MRPVPTLARVPIGGDPSVPGAPLGGWPAAILFAGGAALLLSHALVPLDEFVHRGDDAYYYFAVAANHVRLGFWSFDGSEPTNGVQPLWALMLTLIAHAARAVGVDTPEVLARIFVGWAALVQFASALVVYRLVGRCVSPGTGLVAAGALLLPLGLVWGRLWGLEAPLLALGLAATALHYREVMQVRPTARAAAVLGLLLGLTCLSRLNAGLLAPLLLGFHLFRGPEARLAERVRHVAVAGLAVTALVLPYLAWNLLHTGHPLPVSGVVKSIGVAQALADWGAPGRLSTKMLSYLYYHWGEPLRWFTTSRLLDGFWAVGARLRHDGSTAWATLAGVLAATLLLPALAGGPRAWAALLRERFARLATLWIFGLHAVVDTVVCVVVYPTQTYAIPRWWLIPAELVLAITAATLVTAALVQIGRRIAAPLRASLVLAGVLALVGAHLAQHGRWYWDGQVVQHDWNRSWNDESLLASRWIEQHLPPGTLIGSWNAGVLAWHTSRPVVNLDGLINNAALLPYLRERRIGDYVRQRRIRYLSDMESQTRQHAAGLRLTEVYRHRSAFLRADYVVYRVDETAAGGGP